MSRSVTNRGSELKALPGPSLFASRSQLQGTRCLRWRRRRCGPRAAPCGASAVQTKPLSAEASAAATELEGWQRSRAVLEQRLQLAPDVADSVLSDAFGWGSQVYWRQQKVQQPPSDEQVQQVLDFLTGLGIPEGKLHKLVQTFPQVLGCELSLLQGNVETLQTRWFLKGRGLVSMLERKPQVLGTAVDCEGSCMAECNRCWVRF